jgi:hypothetical protein
MNSVSALGAPSIDSLEVVIETCSITASNFARLWPPSVSPHSLDYGLQVLLRSHSRMTSKCISQQAQLRAAILDDRGLQVHLQTRSNTVSKYISELTRFLPPCLDHHSLHMLWQDRSITASELISEFTHLSLLGTPRIALSYRFQPVQIYRM